MIAFDALERKSKMMIYKIHQLRILCTAILLLSLTILLIILTPPQKCVQVSVSVREWQPYHVKRTRAVQAVDENLFSSKSKTHDHSNVWFRTKLIFPSNANEEEEIEDDDDDRDDDYSEPNENYEDDQYDDVPENKVFEEGDFDYNETIKYNASGTEPDFSIISRMYQAYQNNHLNSSGIKYNSSHNASASSTPLRKSLKHKWRNITLINIEGIPVVEDRIYWSEEIERRSPKGANDDEVQRALKKLRNLNVQKVELPTWNRCGRPKNQYVTFEDGSKACARYRAPHQYLVQGEILSFYLSRLLGINNVPVVSLAAVKPEFQGMWSKKSVKEALQNSNWEVNTTVAIIQWIENLERDRMPQVLLSSLISGNSISAMSSAILKLPTKKLTELLQWSDLIVFDYITGNYDRVASMQDAADKEGKMSILQETIHNLVRSKSNGGLWLIDNESGLLDSYSLLYGATGKDGRFLKFHKQMLDTFCIFRRQTVNRIRWLHESNKPGQILMDVVKKLEPLFTPIKREKDVNKRLQERIAEVNEHIENCLTRLSY